MRSTKHLTSTEDGDRYQYYNKHALRERLITEIYDYPKLQENYIKHDYNGRQEDNEQKEQDINHLPNGAQTVYTVIN